LDQCGVSDRKYPVVVWGVSDHLKKWYYQKLLVCVFVPIMLIALSWATFLQLRYWKNGITLFKHAIEAEKNNTMAHNNLATALGSTDIDQNVLFLKSEPDEPKSQYREIIQTETCSNLDIVQNTTLSR